MKTLLTERREMAKAINMGEYPVLSIDMDNQKYADQGFLQGNDVRVAWDSKNPQYKGMTTFGYVYVENGKYAISGRGACIKAEFTVDDFIKDIHRANTPLVHKGQIVAIAHYSKEVGIKFVKLMKVSDRIDIHCSTVAELEEIE